MSQDTQAFVSACSVCACSKASHQPPAGQLRPLPIPRHPWSHIAVDFITGLPPSERNTTIRTVVDRFSKVVHFIPLPKLPSSTETANLLVLHVFRLHGIPQDIVSDRVTSVFFSGLESLLSSPSSATGMSPFMASLGYQPPLFPDQEEEVAVPSVQAGLHRCRRIWKEVRSALLRSVARTRRLADQRRIPAYRPCQKERQRISAQCRSPSPFQPPGHMDYICIGAMGQNLMFDVYVGSSSSPVTVFTNHNPLVFLAQMYNHNQQLMCRMEPVLCYESRNRSCLKTIYPLPTRITVYTILGVTVILTVCGNLLVTVSIAYFKQLHTPTNYLIASLATSDFLLGLLVMFPSMVQSVETCWYFGDIFYRHYAVCQPLLYRRKMSINVVLIMIVLSWSISALIGFGIIFLKVNLWGIEELYNLIVCEGQCILFQSQLSSTVTSVLSFYIPAIIMLGVYLKIFIVAHRQLRSIQNSSCMRAERISNASQTKATKTLAIIMGAFLSFWTPFFVCNIIDPFIIPPALYKIFGWLGYLNSTVNPLIYAFFYSWFRKALRLLTSGNIFKADISETTLFTE
ncbi:trace amine-associated receptor 1-like [Cyclopterus lumpus]|uniref:trace amine-associated receptor 1-like n=1 Tax=Cyclopterus lumpus TaxID=8103 RepID=UPI00148694DE|nr:trace amine-associated receptor 1-like [Cyclopterus lumpus]